MTYPWLEAVKAEFAERRKSGRMAHALLLTGPAHLGKLELGREFLGSLLCMEDSYPACGQCRSCQLFKTGAHPDGFDLTFEINKDNGKLRTVLIVEQVRRLISSLQLTRTFSPRKAALIHPADAMNMSSANALLKTLEEPPGDSVLILVSSNPARLPATVRSRCQNLHVRLPETSLALEWLNSTEEGKGGQAEIALEAAAGSPLHAQQMIREEGVEQYRLVSGALDALRAGRTATGQIMGDFSAVDPERLWSWLSLRAARELCAMHKQLAGARPLSLLQAEADRNRVMSRSSVRKDLLLQDWLIQWSQLGTTTQ